MSNEINQYADKHDSKVFFKALNFAYGPKYNFNCPIKYMNDVILTKLVK